MMHRIADRLRRSEWVSSDFLLLIGAAIVVISIATGVLNGCVLFMDYYYDSSGLQP